MPIVRYFIKPHALPGLLLLIIGISPWCNNAASDAIRDKRAAIAEGAELCGWSQLDEGVLEPP